MSLKNHVKMLPCFRILHYVTLLVSVFFLISLSGCGNDDPETSCDLDLPSPVLVFSGTEDYTVDEVEYTRYKLSVSNRDAFPDGLFEASPDLPPCGLNASSARTWVDIYDNNDNRLYGFCALGSSDDLDDIWFALPRGQTPPASVYIVLNDRECQSEYRSNSATVFSLFLGNWINEDLESPNITRIEILLNGNQFDVHEWGSCTPVDCDWGTESTMTADALDDVLSLFWDQDFVERTQSIELVTAGRLKVTTASHFVDGSGRPDYTSIEYFIK